METSEAIRSLRGTGINAVPETANVLRTSDGQRIRVSRLRRTPTPANVENELARLHHGEKLLYSVTKLTPALVAAAARDKRIIVVTGDRILRDGRTELHDHVRPAAPARRGPKPYGELAVARALLAATGPLVQVEIAKMSGLRQASVSEALAKLGPLVTKSRVGWLPTDRAQLFDYAANTYPGAGGITMYWWHDENVHTQGNLVADAAEGALLGGDLAASVISGWRQAEHALVYLPTGLDPAKLGFVAAEEGQHTLELVVPADKSLWATAAAFDQLGYTDPVITFYDVLRTGYTGDESEAADKVRAHTLAAH